MVSSQPLQYQRSRLYRRFPMKKIAIFASGQGSNAESIIRYFRTVDHRAEVALVVTNRADAPVINRAANLGVDSVVVSRNELTDGTVLTLLEDRAVDLVVLAGFLLMIPLQLIERYRGHIINIHPSLLPKFGGKGMYGDRVHEAVVAAGERQTGITIHHVNEHYDDGAIIFQATVDLDPTDTPADVARKVRQLELTHFAPIIAKNFL